MEEKQKIEKEFREELQLLLDKYDAEIALSQRGSAYMEYDIIEITIGAVYSKETFKETRPVIEFDY